MGSIVVSQRSKLEKYMFEFILFCILGWATFASPQPNGRLVLMIIFIVLMVLWLAGSLGAFNLPSLNFKR